MDADLVGSVANTPSTSSGEFQTLDSWKKDPRIRTQVIDSFSHQTLLLLWMQFNIGFSSADHSGENLCDKQVKARTKRSRRRRNAKSRSKVEPVQANTVKKHHDAPMTKSDLYFALDCEMVGIGEEGLDSAVARVTLVNWENQVILDTFVQVPVPVTDYRTHISGISPESIHSGNAMPLDEVRSKVENTLRGKILIGHGLDCDLAALGLTHPWCDVRDTATYPPFMREALDPETGKVCLRQRKLRDLAWDVLHRQIQMGGTAHCPVEDSIAALDLYKAVRREWEEELIKIMQEKEKQRQIMEEQQRLRMKWWFHNPASAPPMQMAPPPQTQQQQQPLYEPQVMMRFVPLGPIEETHPTVHPYDMPREMMPYPNEPQPPHVHDTYVPMSEEFNAPQPSSSWFRFGSRRPKSPTRTPPMESALPVVSQEDEPSLPSEASDAGSSIRVEQEQPHLRALSPNSPTSWFRFRRPKSPTRHHELVIPHLVESEESGDSETLYGLVARPRTATASTAPDDEWFQDMYQLEQELNNLVSI